MAERAKAKAKKATTKKGGKIVSRGKVATLPKQSKKAKQGKVLSGSNSGKAVISEEMIKRHEKALRTGLRNIAESQKEVNQERGVYRAARKLAKSEGYNLRAFDINWKLEQEDLGKIQQDYADAALYQRVTDSPLRQISMFDSLLEPEPAAEPAGLRGFKAGERGVVYDNPYQVGTDDFVEYDSQYKAGQAKLGEGIKPTDSVN